VGLNEGGRIDEGQDHKLLLVVLEFAHHFVFDFVEWSWKRTKLLRSELQGLLSHLFFDRFALDHQEK